MTCDEVRRVLSLETLTEEGGGEQALRIHTRDCAACRAAIDRFLSDERLLREWFAAGRRSAPAPSAPRRPNVFLRRGAMAAAAVVVAIFAWRTWRAPEARVTAVDGGAFGDGLTIAMGLELTEGQTIVTQRDAAVELALPDESILRLGPNSRVRLGPGRRRGLAASLEAGKLNCRVAHGDGAFRIGTPCGDVTAMGTEFEVSFSPGPGGPAASTPAQGDTVMTYAGGIPNAAILTVAVVAGWIEFNGGGATTPVHAKEMLVAPQDGTPRVTGMTGAAPPIEAPALGRGGAVRQIQPAVSALALSPDGTKLAICVRQLSGADLTPDCPAFVGVNLWNMKAGRLEGFIPLNGAPSDAVFTADGALWVTEAVNNELRRLDVASLKVLETAHLNRPPDQLTSDLSRIYPGPDGKRVVISGFNTSKAVYAYPGWKLETVLEGPTDRLPVEGAWSADGGTFVAGTLDHRLQVWTLPREAAAATRSAHRPKPSGEGTAPVFGPDGRIWALTVDGMAFGPAEAAGSARRRFVSAGPEWLVARFSPDGKRVAIGAADGSVLVFAVADATLLQRIGYAAPPEVTPWAENLLWAPDGSWLAIGRLDGSSSLARFKP